MKKLLILLIIFANLNFAFADINVNGLLAKVNMSAADVQGMTVLRGELTGAGKGVPLDHLQMLLLKDNIIFKEEIIHLKLNTHGQPEIADIVEVEALGQRIPISRFQGAIVR